MARPKLEFKFDAESIEKMAEIGVPVEDMANILGCDKGTIYNRFSTEIAKGRSNRKTRLRMKQDEVALDHGNVAMLIWLGKQDLDQSEKIEQKTEDVTRNQTIRIELHRDEDTPDKPGQENPAASKDGSVDIKI